MLDNKKSEYLYEESESSNESLVEDSGYDSMNTESLQNPEFQKHLENLESDSRENQAVDLLNQFSEKLSDYSDVSNVEFFIQKLNKDYPNLHISQWLNEEQETVGFRLLSKNFGELIKEQMLASELSSEQIVNEVSQALELINSELSEFEKENKVRNGDGERLQRTKEEESTISKIRKFLKGDSNKE